MVWLFDFTSLFAKIRDPLFGAMLYAGPALFLMADLAVIALIMAPRDAFAPKAAAAAVLPGPWRAHSMPAAAAAFAGRLHQYGTEGQPGK